MRTKNLLKDNSGTTILEMAIIIPIILIITFAVIEFGFYFVKWEIVQRAATQIANYVQTAQPNKVTVPATEINNEVKKMVARLGMGIINLEVCANQSSDPNSLKIDCDNGDVHIGRYGAGIPNDQPYQVQILVRAAYSPITGFSNLAKVDIPKQLVARVNVTVLPEKPTNPNASCTATQFITYDATSNTYTCKEIATDYNGNQCADGMVISYNSSLGKFICNYSSPKITNYVISISSDSNDTTPTPIGEHDYCALSEISFDERDYAGNSRLRCRVLSSGRSWSLSIRGYNVDYSTPMYCKAVCFN